MAEKPCPQCGGKGKVEAQFLRRISRFFHPKDRKHIDASNPIEEIKCPVCNGSGKVKI